jgi:hypothetical protein
MTPLHRRFRLLACTVLLGAAGCAATGPPVQEMSDARQAIAAAREAGAATLDDDNLRSAELQLAQAEAQLQQRMYWDARRLAVNAKETAIAALLRSRSLREAGAAPDAAPQAPVPGPPAAPAR